MPIVADAAAAIRADMSGFNRDLQAGGEKATKTLGQQLKSVFSPRNLAIAGVAGGVAIAGAITAGLADAVRALIDIERLNAQTDAVIRSTSGVANVTREAIEAMSEAAESATTIEREDVQDAANLLLTFTKIRDEIGNGNDIFTQATDAVLDMSVAMGTDARSAAMQLGKALNDPVKGMMQLGRAGVQFTDEQQALVKSLVATGDLLGAQKVILAELETQFGGSAEAFANTTAGRIQRFQNDVGNMFESIVVGATKVADFLGDDPLEGFAMNFGEQAERVRDMSRRMGEDFDELKTRIERRMDETGESFGEAARQIENDWHLTKEDVVKTSSEMMNESLAALEAGREGMVTAAETSLRDPVIDALLGGKEEAERIAAETPGGIAQALLDNQFSVEDAMAEMARVAEESLHPMIERTQIIGFLSSQELADGLTDGDPAVRAASLALKQAAESRLGELSGDAYSYGANMTRTFAAGIVNNLGVVRDASRQLATTARSQIAIESEPPDHSSPLYGITKWGGNIVKTLADGIYASLGTGSAAAGALAGALVPGFGVPAFAGTVPATAATGTGPTYIINVNGVQKTVSSAEEAMEVLRELGAFSEGRLNG